MPALARDRGHRLAAYRQCWADPWCWIVRDVVETGAAAAVVAARRAGWHLSAAPTLDRAGKSNAGEAGAVWR
jgi:hypothetical protein